MKNCLQYKIDTISPFQEPNRRIIAQKRRRKKTNVLRNGVSLIFSVIFICALQYIETNHTDLRFYVASYTKLFDFMNKLELSYFDHWIKKLTIDSLLRKFLHF